MAKLFAAHLFLDLTDKLHISPNQGLMCIAFHPKYQQNGRYFVKHEVKEDAQVMTLIVERQASEDRLRDSGKSSKRLAAVGQPPRSITTAAVLSSARTACSMPRLVMAARNATRKATPRAYGN